MNINEDLIKKQADACVSTCLKDVGYTYINTDDGFFGGRVTKTITLKKGINHIRLSNSKGAMPEIDYMELRK